jgi:hypothetical protein
MFSNQIRASQLFLLILATATTACNSGDSGTAGTPTTGTGSGTTTSCGNAQAAPRLIAKNEGAYLETSQAGLKKLSGHIPRAAQAMSDQGKLDVDIVHAYFE